MEKNFFQGRCPLAIIFNPVGVVGGEGEEIFSRGVARWLSSLTPLGYGLIPFG